ncbi:hypothetical protein [Aquabacterium sp.]|uniref:hypothetical protein n=1 Tax=Aquabacterium sp. TaxID=1872578 RepID=UPI003D6CD6B0
MTDLAVSSGAKKELEMCRSNSSCCVCVFPISASGTPNKHVTWRQIMQWPRAIAVAHAKEQGARFVQAAADVGRHATCARKHDRSVWVGECQWHATVGQSQNQHGEMALRHGAAKTHYIEIHPVRHAGHLGEQSLRGRVSFVSQLLQALPGITH